MLAESAEYGFARFEGIEPADGAFVVTTWVHPNTDIDLNLGDPIGFPIKYEALSYNWGTEEHYTIATAETLPC